MGTLTDALGRRPALLGALLASEARAVAGPLLVVGDLNASTLSPSFARLLWRTGLRVATATRWPDATYHAYGRLAVRLDHVLVRGVGVAGEQVFELAGSDHRGVAVEVALLPPEQHARSAR
ncbi:MAG: hypothetical protein FJZ92_11080 [Chloroflexi bacterium]|nr:hypothetical protein [Chloroflexota bacterium]